MQKRRLRYLICVLAVILAACSILFACDGSYKNKEKLPLKPWQDYILDVSRAIDLQYVEISTTQPIAVDMSVNALDETSDDRYECSLMLNINPLGRDSQQGSLQIIRKNGAERKVLLDIYNDGDKLYWCKWDNGSYERTSFDNAPLLYSLQEVLGSFGEDLNYSTLGAVFEFLADIFFTDGSVTNADGSSFVFRFDLKKGLQSEKARSVFDGLPQVLQKIFLSIAGVDSYDEMLDKTPSLSGNVNIDLKDKMIDKVYCDRLYYADVNGSEQALSIDMPLLKVSNCEIDLSSRIPDGSHYDAGRLADVTTSGKVEFVNSRLDRVEMQYDYTFSAKIDVLELLACQGDLNVLKDDNFFHFKMTHKCTSECSEFCKDKYDSAKGAILDVAFSPSDFGTHDVYISIGARALLGTDSLSKLTDAEGLVKQLLPEYVLAVVTADSLNGKNNSVGSGGKTEGAVKGIIEKVLIALEYNETALSFSVSEMVDAFGMGEEFKEVIDSVFQSEKYFIDTVNIRQEQFVPHVKKYDVKRSAIHLYGNDVSGTKRYGIINPTVKFVFDAQDVEVNGKNIQVMDIYNDIYKDGVLASYNTPICEEEFDSLIGSTVTAKAENIYGEISNQSLYIVNHSQIDVTRLGWQEVELQCLPMGAGVIEKYVWRMLKEQEWSKWLTVTAKTYVYVDSLESISFIRPQNTSYRQGDRFISSNRELMDIEATLTFGRGNIKSRFVEASNYEELFMTDSSGNRFIKSNEDVMLSYYLFDSYCGTKVSVSPSDTKQLVAGVDRLELEYSDRAYSTQLCVVSIRWSFADGTSRDAKLPLSCMRINGYAIEEENDYFYYIDTDIRDGLVFKRDGQFTLSFEYEGMAVQLPLIITPRAQDEDKSEYEIDFTSSANKYYFVGYEYDFNAEIFNTYHGEVGDSKELSFEIRKGTVNSSGNLTYVSIAEIQEYYDITRILLAGQEVNLPYQVELPPTVYNNMQLRLRVMFKQSGYYQLTFNLDGKTCVREIYVSVPI